MRTGILFSTMSVLALLYSASVSAHSTGPGGVLPHIFTGEHLLALVVVGVCVAAIGKYYRRFR